MPTEATEEHSLPLLHHLARVGTRAAYGALAPTGLRPRHLTALRLLVDQGAATQQGLAGALALDPRNVVALLNELEERALVIRRRDPSDRRRHIVEIDELGRIALRDAQGLLAASEALVLRGLSGPERVRLYGLLAKAVDAHRDGPGRETDAQAETPWKAEL